MIIVLIKNEETRECIEFPLLDRYVIGRNRLADILLQEKYIEDYHFRIELTASGKVLLKTIDQNSKLSFKNELLTYCYLSANDVVAIGSYKIFIDTKRISMSELRALTLVEEE